MRLNGNENIFLIYFLPLFVLKMIGFTADNVAFMVVGVLCALFILIIILSQKYNPKLFRIFLVSLLYSMILVVTSGKQALFFTVLMIIAMKGVNLNRNILRICFYVGAISLLIACYLERASIDTTRYVNGEWVDVVKRSNILFVQYTAVVSIYLLWMRNHITNKHIIYIVITSIFLYLYTTSRTGIIAILFLIALISLFRIKKVRNNRVFKLLIVSSPLTSLSFCLCSAIFYGNGLFWEVLNMLLQGRIYQNSAFWHHYDLRLFGQHIIEKSDGTDMRILDCAYMDMIICQGILFALLWTTITIYVINYFYKKGRTIEVSIIVTYAIYGISETFLPNCFLNISLFLYGECLYDIFKKVNTYNLKNKLLNDTKSNSLLLVRS